MARWDDEELKFAMPDIEKIPCENCFLREKDRPETGIKGATLGVCEAYKSKPDAILFKGESCPYFIDENESDDEEGEKDESK